MTDWKHATAIGRFGFTPTSPIRHLTVCAMAVVTLAASACRAETASRWSEWGRAVSVQDQTDVIHLNSYRLRTWKALELQKPAVRKFLKKEYRPLWLAALNSHDRELRRNALLSIGQAHHEGFMDFSEFSEAVHKTFLLDDLRPETRTDAVRTLVILNARSSAPDLMKFLKVSPQLRQLAERAFAEWDYAPARELWMERLTQPDTCPASQMTLALRGLSRVRHEPAADTIRNLVVSPSVSVPLRLTAARALADLQTTGLEETAQLLLSQTETRDFLPELLAGTLLQRHRSPAAQSILQDLLNSSSGAAAAQAWQRLNAVDPQSVATTHLQSALHSRDARVRLLAVQNCGLRSELPVDSLMAALNDHHPDVRCQARHILRDRSSQADNDTARVTATRIRDELKIAFQSESWRGLEQVSLLSAELNHAASAVALVELLRHPRDEVAASAAFALKELAVPAVLPQMLRHALHLDSRMATDRSRVSRRAKWVQPHLFESFAGQHYRPAEELLRKYVSKTPFRYGFAFCRMAAIWSLGHLHAGQPDAELIQQFTQRMFDQSMEEPESEQVISASALALGIMQNQASLNDLRKLTSLFDQGMPQWQAAVWSISRLTGEPVPPPRAGAMISRSDWFLNPVSSSPK